MSPSDTSNKKKPKKDTVANATVDGTIAGKEQMTLMKNKRLDLSYVQMKWETVFRRILIVMSVIMLIVVAGILASLKFLMC